MKYNPFDDEMTGQRRTGRPPLPADTKYREQEQAAEMLEDLDDDAPIGNAGNNEIPVNVEGAQTTSELHVDVDDQAGDDEDAYHPITQHDPKR